MVLSRRKRGVRLILGRRGPGTGATMEIIIGQLVMLHVGPSVHNFQTSFAVLDITGRL